MNKSQFDNLLRFLILMGGEKMLEKAPRYILEKYERYVGDPVGVQRRPEDQGIDFHNQQLFEVYQDRWNVEEFLEERGA